MKRSPKTRPVPARSPTTKLSRTHLVLGPPLTLESMMRRLSLARASSCETGEQLERSTERPFEYKQAHIIGFVVSMCCQCYRLVITGEASIPNFSSLPSRPHAAPTMRDPRLHPAAAGHGCHLLGGRGGLGTGGATRGGGAGLVGQPGLSRYGPYGQGDKEAYTAQ